jgi:sugar (pentulose or hexulose) kinase
VGSGDVLVGIDVGTTYSKATAVSLDGVERGHGRVPTAWRGVPSGAEADPAALVENALAAARKAISAAGSERVVAIGVTSMAETGVLLDRGGDPVVPAIVWHDRRGEEEARSLAADIGADEFTAHTGLRVGPMCTAVKYRWMRANWPATKRGVRWLNVAEWIVAAMGGDVGADPSLASRTGWLDVLSGRWWDATLAWAEAPPGLLAETAGAGTSAGGARTALAEARGAVLTVAGHDHLCASIGAGASREGDVFDSCGSAESLLRAVADTLGPEDLLRANRGRVSVGRHVRWGSHAAMGGFRSGLALQRVLDLLGGEPVRRRLDEEALALEGAPNTVHIKGLTEDEFTISGIGRDATAAHIWRAALETIQRRGVEVLGTLETIGGPCKRLVATGGGLQSDAVRRVKREFLGDFVEPAVREAGARGAALLAGIAAGIYPGVRSLPAPDFRGP